MHLIVVSPFPPTITGIGQYGYHVTRGLAASGAFERITVLAGSNPNGENPKSLGTTELDYCWAPGRWQTPPVILSRVNRLRPDLVWFNLGASVFGRSPWVNLSGILTPMLVQRMGFPTVVTLHELAELSDLRALQAPGGPLAKLGARLITHIATRADVLCLTMRHYAEWLQTRNVECAHIPIGAYHEPNLLEESDSQEILFFTTLAPFKGLELLLEAFQRLRAHYSNLKLTIAGSEHIRFPNYGRELKERFADVRDVAWLGQTSEDEVQELFRRAQVIALPYLASTGSSSVLYQAATWGRAVAASNLDEIRTVAMEGNLQVEFFETGNVQGLCAALRGLLDSPEKRYTLAKHNFEAIQYTRPHETNRRYLQAFDRALEKRRSPKRIASLAQERHLA